MVSWVNLSVCCSRVFADESESVIGDEDGGRMGREEDESSEVLVDRLCAGDARRNYVVHQTTLGLIVMYTGYFA